MTWYSLTHGWHGLAFGAGLVAVPMWIGLAQGKASVRRWVQSPVWAVLFLIGGGLLYEFVQSYIAPHRNNSDSNVLVDVLGILWYVLVGYAGGRFLASKYRPGEAHKRGSLLEEGRAAQRETQRLKRRDNRVISLAGIAVNPEDEVKHFKLIGTTGTGKSTAIRELLGGALERGDRAVVADPDGSYLARFHDPRRGDVVLNPFEPASVQWDLFAEIRQPYDVEQLAGALIAVGEDGSGRDWRAYARTFVTALIRRCYQNGNRDLGELWRLLAIASAEELRPIVAGTPAQPFLEPDNARMFGSIRSVASSALGSLEYIQAQRAAPFSVREWVRSGRGVLFIPYQAGQIAALRSVIAAWLRLAIFEAMTQPEGDQRLWFVVDELDALGAIDGLKDALARLRKFGGRCVLGFQSIAQVSSTYGAGDAQTIVENCGNTLILRCSAAENGGTARFASRLIGEREIVRTEISRSSSQTTLFSRGGSHVGESVSDRHVTESAVMPSEIEQLPDLAGFLKFASYPAWMRVALTPHR